MFDGKLYAMPMPAGESLDQNMTALRDKGIDRVVCLLEESESKALGLANELTACHAAGMQYHQFPIPDYGVPQTDKLELLITGLTDELHAGQNIVVHCRGGIGRTGLVCCCLLVASGMDADNAMSLVRTKRGCSVPETDAQTDMIRQFAAMR